MVDQEGRHVKEDICSLSPKAVERKLEQNRKSDDAEFDFDDEIRAVKNKAKRNKSKQHNKSLHETLFFYANIDATTATTIADIRNAI